MRLTPKGSRRFKSSRLRQFDKKLNLKGEPLPTFKVAIVGAGPAGYFTAQALQNAQTEELTFQIDMIERLPTPWGLVRSGVAPDHPKIKTVSKVFEKIANNPDFRLFGNVELGKDLKLNDLKAKYDALVLCLSLIHI